MKRKVPNDVENSMACIGCVMVFLALLVLFLGLCLILKHALKGVV